MLAFERQLYKINSVLNPPLIGRIYLSGEQVTEDEFIKAHTINEYAIDNNNETYKKIINAIANGCETALEISQYSGLSRRNVGNRLPYIVARNLIEITSKDKNIYRYKIKE